MNISGQIRSTLPPATLAKALRNREILAELMPIGCVLSQSGPDAFAFVLKRKFGPVELALPGTIVVASEDARHCVTFHAAHLLFGKADIALTITMSEANKITILDYEGTVKASGLAWRILAQTKQRTVDERVRKAFVRFKSLVTAAMGAASA